MRALIIFICVLCAAPLSAQEVSTPMREGPKVWPPIGWIGFCNRLPQECNGLEMQPLAHVLDERAWRSLVKVNSFVNKTIKGKSDWDHWGLEELWSYPDDGYGDCEDYALLKKRMLIQEGWPPQSLRLTWLRENNGNFHVVLTIVTSKGDYILDIMTQEILPWTKTLYWYNYIMRQSGTHPNRWVAIEK